MNAQCNKGAVILKYTNNIRHLGSILLAAAADGDIAFLGPVVMQEAANETDSRADSSANTVAGGIGIAEVLQNGSLFVTG